jgi:hypothetical protein
MRCAKCQKSLPQTNSHSGTLLSLSAGSLVVSGISYAISFLKPGLTLAAGAVAVGAFATACKNSIRTYSASATAVDASGVPCPHCTHVNFWGL